MQKFAQKKAEVVKLDKGFPLICIDNTQKVRAEFNSFLSKKHTCVAIGDHVLVSMGDGPCDGDGPCIIEEVLPRKTKLIRNDPVNRKQEQVLAANFDSIAVCVVAGQENFNHLARMLTIACNTNVPITLVFTKCDLVKPNLEVVSDITGNVSPRIIMSEANEKSQAAGSEDLCSSGGECLSTLQLHPLDAGSVGLQCEPQDGFKGGTCVLLGKSGVGKSTLINTLAGKEVCKQGDVREYDSKGRHTTVAREIVDVGGFGRIVDMPGVRSLGLINCERGLHTVFSSIFNLASKCKFRNCKHTGELGCAVAGNVSDQLLASYHELVAENEKNSGLGF